MRHSIDTQHNMPSVMFEIHYAECHYVERQNAERRGAPLLAVINRSPTSRQSKLERFFLSPFSRQSYISG